MSIIRLLRRGWGLVSGVVGSKMREKLSGVRLRVRMVAHDGLENIAKDVVFEGHRAPVGFAFNQCADEL